MSTTSIDNCSPADKSVLVIGCGIAGLAAAVYLQSSGFSVTILEKHNAPGGLSTNWSRGGYLFEGGMHWLTGSDPRLALNRIWREVGALTSNNPIINRDPIYTLIDGDKRLRLWRNLDALKEEFDAYAPEDKKATRRLISDIKKYLNVHLVITDLLFLRSTRPARPPLWEYIRMASAGLAYNRLRRTSYIDYVNMFSNRNIRHLLMSVIGYRYNALSFIYTMASFSSGDCGYPEGGSRLMAQNMADKFTALGGKIRYNTCVKKIAVNDERAEGVITRDGLLPSKHIIVTQDTLTAIDMLFTPPLNDKWAIKMRRTIAAEQNMFLCMGITADLSSYPETMILPLSEGELFEAGGCTFNELRLNNYSAATGHAPEGCATLTCILLCDCYDWWKDKKDKGTYKAEKDALMQRFISKIEEKLPEIHGKVAVTDVATPLTYERYTGSYKGSWMSVWLPNASPFAFPAKCSIDGVYFASERCTMPGGLPLTVHSGRRAAQTLCRDEGCTFVVPKIEGEND